MHLRVSQNICCLYCVCIVYALAMTIHENRSFYAVAITQRWFLATESLSQIFISKILISEIVYENWRALAVIREINATLWTFCTLRSGLRK